MRIMTHLAVNIGIYDNIYCKLHFKIASIEQIILTISSLSFFRYHTLTHKISSNIMLMYIPAPHTLNNYLLNDIKVVLPQTQNIVKLGNNFLSTPFTL